MLEELEELELLGVTDVLVEVVTSAELVAEPSSSDAINSCAAAEGGVGAVGDKISLARIPGLL